MANQPPLRARLHWYQLSASELSLLTAMCEHCSDGSTIWASIARLAAYSKLSERNVQRLVRGLCGRGILTQLAPSSTAKRRPTTYRINEAALQDDQRMVPYRAYQQQLPAIRRPAVPGEPIPDATLVTPRHQSCDMLSPQPMTPCHPSGDTASPNSKAFDSKTINSKPMIQHGDAALNSMPAWTAFKEQLRAELSDVEWNLWVRPMFLLRAMPVSADQKHLLAAIPPNGRIQSAAIKRLPMMRELLAPTGLNISLTHYPDQWEIDEAKRRYGTDIAPKPWTRNA
jgi:hypothetical protein